MPATRVRYTLADVGCYVDGSRGIYAIDRIVEIAQEHGMSAPICEHDDDADHDGQEIDHCTWAGCEFVGEAQDKCDDYMNEHHGVDGAFWGRSEAGDWGLWECEE